MNISHEDNLSWEEVRRLLDYDRATGLFRWRKPYPKSRSVKIGRVAGALDVEGYVRISIRNRPFRAHRLAWKWVHGVWPADEIDHEDTDRSNNALANLRPATGEQNKWNVGLTVRNTSGFKGVSLIKKTGKWCATIHLNGRNINLGHYDAPELAAAAYRNASLLHHGPFARAS